MLRHGPPPIVHVHRVSRIPGIPGNYRRKTSPQPNPTCRSGSGDRFTPGAGPEAMERGPHRRVQGRGWTGSNMEGGSWTNSISWVSGAMKNVSGAPWKRPAPSSPTRSLAHARPPRMTHATGKRCSTCSSPRRVATATGGQGVWTGLRQGKSADA